MQDAVHVFFRLNKVLEKSSSENNYIKKKNEHKKMNLTKQEIYKYMQGSVVVIGTANGARKASSHPG